MSKELQGLADRLMGGSGGAVNANASELRALADSQDGQQVRRLMGDEERLMEAIRRGDKDTLQAVMQRVLSSEEGARLAKRLSELLK